MRQALSLCQSLLNYEQRLEAAYFEAVRPLLTRIEGKGKISLFDPKFLEEISRMKERNFAVELLRKLIAE